ncbi:MAG: heterodisulfide reductase-related iron-sulfur binding cluster [Candidatus Bathyarchaeia archaeon]
MVEVELGFPIREHFWNIPEPLHLIPYISLAVALVTFVWGIYGRYKLVFKTTARGGLRIDRVGDRLKGLLAYAVAQLRVSRKPYAGIMHAGIFWGIIFLALGTGLVFLETDLLIPLLSARYLVGGLYLLFEAVLDFFGAFLILGIIMALYRRYILKPESLGVLAQDKVVLGSLLAIALTGFMVEGLRIAASPVPWQGWSFVGNALAGVFTVAGLGEGFLKSLHLSLWLIHMGLSLALIAVAPYTRLLHVITAPINIFFRSLNPRGALSYIDLEKEDTLGAGEIQHLTWKHLLDLFACTECGRCQDNCPAHLTKKPLNPKKVILDLKRNLLTNGKTLLKKQATQVSPIIGDLDGQISQDVIWSCTTCAACVEQCPVFIEQFLKIIEMRRYLVLTEGSVSPDTARLFRDIEFNGNPWGLPQNEREKWAESLSVKRVGEEDALVRELDNRVLLFVGCSGSYDSRNKRITESLAKILTVAGVNFVILGNGERCCGDPARRLGNEYLFQTMARENIQIFNEHKIKKIVTICPHCFNTLKNEYPQLGGEYEVVHHSEFVLELLKDWKVKLTKSVDEVVTYHDPCYLGRHNKVYDAPRGVLQRVPGIRLKDMERCRYNSFCCGGGGGRVWMEETLGEKINVNRAKQALELNVNTIVTACPYCLTMFDDGLKSLGKEESVKLLDLAEVVARAM